MNIPAQPVSETTTPATQSANFVPPNHERLVVLGRIRSAVGLAGWVKVESFTEPADNILKYRTWQLCAAPNSSVRAVRLNSSRWSGRELQIQFDGITDRDSADLLRNTDIAVFRRELPPPPPGEYYRDDLLGLMAFTPQGARLGKLDHYVDSPAHPFMVLHDLDEQQRRVENLVPLVKGRVLNVDFEQGTMVLDWTLDWVE